ncbi:MAG TPA: hypothetical protein VLZ81_08430, partial [Blastocatellia bacterium]|nr:hypothetical protein [Blastocatellia bacterium]
MVIGLADGTLSGEFDVYERDIADPQHAEVQFENEGWNRTVYSGIAAITRRNRGIEELTNRRLTH